MCAADGEWWILLFGYMNRFSFFRWVNGPRKMFFENLKKKPGEFNWSHFECCFFLYKNSHSTNPRNHPEGFYCCSASARITLNCLWMNEVSLFVSPRLLLNAHVKSFLLFSIIIEPSNTRIQLQTTMCVCVCVPLLYFIHKREFFWFIFFSGSQTLEKLRLSAAKTKTCQKKGQQKSSHPMSFCYFRFVGCIECANFGIYTYIS